MHDLAVQCWRKGLPLVEFTLIECYLHSITRGQYEEVFIASHIVPWPTMLMACKVPQRRVQISARSQKRTSSLRRSCCLMVAPRASDESPPQPTTAMPKVPPLQQKHGGTTISKLTVVQ
jgi:hypothetical protein